MADCSRPGDQQQEVLNIMRVYSSVGDSTFQRGGGVSHWEETLWDTGIWYMGGAATMRPVTHGQQCPAAARVYATDRQTNRQTYQQTNRQTDQQTDKQTNQQTNRWTDGHRRRVNPSFYSGCLIVKGRHEDLRYSEKSTSNTEYKRTKNMR